MAYHDREVFMGEEVVREKNCSTCMGMKGIGNWKGLQVKQLFKRLGTFWASVLQDFCLKRS